MDVKELITRFGFEVDEKPLHDMEKGIAAIKDGLLGLGVSIGASVVGLFELANTTAESREQMLKLSEQTGMSVESFSRLAAAAKLGHMDVEEFGMAFTFLNRNLFKASQGGFEATKAFTDLGISQNDLKTVGFQTDKVLAMIAARAKALPEGFRKSAVMTELFGRSGAKMIPFLNRMKEFQSIGDKMGVGVTKEQAEQSEEFLVKFAEFGMILRGIKNAVAGELIPVFTKIIDGTNQWLLANRAIIKANLLGFAKALGKYLQDVFFWGMKVANAFMDVVKVFGGAESATRMFLTTVGLLSAVSVLFGIGKMVQAVIALAGAFEIADVAALLIPLAIGALIAALVLLAEDVYSYFNGKDSLLGIFLEKFPDAIQGVIEWVHELTDALMAPFKFLKDIAGGALDSVNNFVGAGVSNAFGLLGMGPSDASAGGGGAGNDNSNVSVSAPITVTVPEGTPPGQVAGAVQAGVGDGLGALLRTTRRATAGGVAY